MTPLARNDRSGSGSGSGCGSSSPARRPPRRPGGHCPAVTALRCRATYICAQLTSGSRFDTLQAAAVLTSPRSLGDWAAWFRR